MINYAEKVEQLRDQIIWGPVNEMLMGFPEQAFHMAITSPPYWGLRAYLDSEDEWKHFEIGNEKTPEEYIDNLVEIFRGVWRVLRDDGILILNLGDSYAHSIKGSGGTERSGLMRDGRDETQRKQTAAESIRHQMLNKPQLFNHGLKPKDLCMIPERVALALQADGWYLRSKIPWVKWSALPESCTDRPTVATETIYLLAKNQHYFWDQEAIKMSAVKGASGSRFDKGKTGTRDGGDRTQEGYRDNTGRQRRDTDWFFDSLRAILEDKEQGLLLGPDGEPLALTVNPVPFKAAHYALFPPRLVTPFVKAGASEHGVCPSCGAPFERIVERKQYTREGEIVPNKRDGGLTTEHGLERTGLSHYKYNEQLKKNAPQTVGWQSNCCCRRREPIPALVLDPFMGAGTTGLVCKELGRSYTGVELVGEYVDMANDRIAGKLK